MIRRHWLLLAAVAAVLLTVLVFAGLANQPAPATPNPAGTVASAAHPVGDAGIPRYDRDAFGGWARGRGQCDTRELVLERDSGDRAADTDHDGCGDDGMLVDVYTGNLIRAQDAQIDHVFPLAEAWRRGAYQWPRARLHLFANDQSNLRAVLGRVNQDKSDLTPAQMLAPPAPGKPVPWQPPTAGGRCALATIWRATALRWDLPIPPADDAALRTMAADCGHP